MYDGVSEIEDARGFGGKSIRCQYMTGQPPAKNAELDRLEAIYRSLLKNAGVTLIRMGKISGPHEVTANGVSYSAKNILVAVGVRLILLIHGPYHSRHNIE